MSSPENTHHRPAAVTRWVARLLSAFLLTFLGFTLLLLLFLIALQKRSAFRNRVRRFNKRSLNPAVLNSAGGPASPYAVVHHVGRRSGRTYATPVMARPTRDGFVLPLYYGRDVDWCRNVLSAGGCTISRKGSDYAVREPEVIDLAAVVPLVPLPRWRAWLWGSVLVHSPLGAVPFLHVKHRPEVTGEASARTEEGATAS